MLNMDAFYADCPNCETNVLVSRDPSRLNDTFRCEKCDETFNDDEFDAVFDYPKPKQRIYILKRHAGYDFEEIAHYRKENEREVRGIYQNVLNHVADNKRQPAQTREVEA